MRRPWILGMALVALGTVDVMLGQSAYHVSIDTSAVKGQPGKLALNLTSNRLRTNRVDIFNFTTDGKLALPETLGGLVSGDLIEGKIPSSFTRIAGGAFFNELTLNFETFGSRTSFTINISESATRGSLAPDQFALYILDAEGQPLITPRHWVSRVSPDKRGEPNFTITINGERGGQLEIFDKPVDKRRRGKIEAEDPDRDFRVHFSVTPVWVSQEEEHAAPSVTFQGTLQEFCTRRCIGQPTCTGGEFGVALSEEKFLRFDDVGNLKARVALVEHDKDTANVLVTVIGSLISDTVIRVREVTVF